VAAAVVGVVLFSTVTPVASAATQETPTESFGIDLQADGSATVTLTTTYDLASANESDAFEQLRNDEQARERFESRFRERMGGVAADASNETGREMAVSGSSIDFRTEGDTGVVELAVTWEGLAAVENDRLVVTEPFASGFAPDREFRLSVPDGYAVTSVTPGAATNADGTVTWDAGTSLDGFSVTAEPTGETAMTTEAPWTTTASPTGTSSGDGPGFGIVLTITALLGAGFLARRRP